MGLSKALQHLGKYFMDKVAVATLRVLKVLKMRAGLQHNAMAVITRNTSCFFLLTSSTIDLVIFYRRACSALLPQDLQGTNHSDFGTNTIVAKNVFRMKTMLCISIL